MSLQLRIEEDKFIEVLKSAIQKSQDEIVLVLKSNSMRSSVSIPSVMPVAVTMLRSGTTPDIHENG